MARWLAAWGGGVVIGVANGIAREAMRVGRAWLALTITFEFAFGR